MVSLVLGLAVEANLGSQVSPQVQQVEDPAGRRLFLLVLDSLSIDNAAQMPALVELSREGFYAEVEPCLERITYLCIKETLTGRGAFSFFGLLRNFGVGNTDPGANLLRDAREAGKKVAMVSAGDLEPFHVDLDTNELFDDHYTPRELKTAIRATEDHDIVLWHYIWHDTRTHHGGIHAPDYAKSVADMDVLVTRLRQAMPEDMDLVVTGDHGHAEDGRHVQGLDIPTVVIASSPHLRPQRLEADPDDPSTRLPITALRFLGGVSTGLYTNQAEWKAEWAQWLTASVDPSARALVEAGPPPAPPRRFPLGMVILCLGAAGAIVSLRHWPARLGGPAIPEDDDPGFPWSRRGGWVLAMGALAMGALLGSTFEAWLDQMHFPPDGWRIHTIYWRLPIGIAVVVLLWKRSWVWAWRAVSITGAVSLLVLYPVVHHYGVLKNAAWLALPCTVGAALAVTTPDLSPRATRTPSARLRALALLAGSLLAAWGWVQFSDFRIFNLEIIKYRAVTWVPSNAALAALVLGVLAGTIHRLIDPHRGWVAAATVGAMLGTPLPDMAYAVPCAGLLVALCWRSPHRGRWIHLCIALSAPYVYGPQRALGLYVLATLIAFGLWIIRRPPPNGVDPTVATTWRSAQRWAAMTTLLLGGYLGMAWSFGLTVSGIDFTFMIHWLPGRLHERLWWLIAIGTTLKVILPNLLAALIAHSLLGDRALAWVRSATSWVLVRYVVISTFGTAWIISSGPNAAGLRLAAL
ncbi:MAG: alkaline phosphatase family protein, partial [Myxococcota bacterium]|nr:alkaline phosphatase family protein [Myxococcota bacterium]